MGKTAKIILGVLGFFVLACIVAGVVSVTFVKKKIGNVAEEMQRQQTEARTWARGHAQAECLDQGMVRARTCAGFTCQMGVQTFTSNCLSLATPTPGLCEGVPHPQDFQSGSIWRNGRCPITGTQSAPDATSTACLQVMSILQAHCAARAARADAAVAPMPTAEPTPAPTAAPTP